MISVCDQKYFVCKYSYFLIHFILNINRSLYLYSIYKHLETTLDNIITSQTVIITRINAGKGLGNRLANMGLHIGDSLHIIRSGQFGGPIIISINNSEFAIGRGIAKKIIVTAKTL